jgi:hypothetical protein
VSTLLQDTWGLAVRQARRGSGAGWLDSQGLPAPTPERVSHALEGRPSAIGAADPVFDLPLETILGVLPIEPISGGLWAPSPQGQLAVIQPVGQGYASPGAIAELVDMAAWFPGRPDNVRLLRGVGLWLGDAEPPPDADPDWRLTLVANPKSWLQRPDCVCPLVWSTAILARLAPYGGQALRCADLALAKTVDMLLQRARLPALEVEGQPEAVAA